MSGSSAMSDSAGESVLKSQEALGRKKAKDYKDLKPHEDNVDKAAWALGTVDGLVETPDNNILNIAEHLGQSAGLNSISPPSPEEAEEWEKGEDANRLKRIYKGLGMLKGTMNFLGMHLKSAIAVGDEIDPDAPLEEQYQQAVKAGEYIVGPLIDGLNSATAAVDKAQGFKGFSGHVGNIET